MLVIDMYVPKNRINNKLPTPTHPQGPNCIAVLYADEELNSAVWRIYPSDKWTIGILPVLVNKEYYEAVSIFPIRVGNYSFTTCGGVTLDTVIDNLHLASTIRDEVRNGLTVALCNFANGKS